jgi:hypothetical protein
LGRTHKHTIFINSVKRFAVSLTHSCDSPWGYSRLRISSTREKENHFY